jgi:hypothetical protein
MIWRARAARDTERRVSTGGTSRDGLFIRGFVILVIPARSVVGSQEDPCINPGPEQAIDDTAHRVV